MRAVLMFHNCEGQRHKTVSTDHNLWRERRAIVMFHNCGGQSHKTVSTDHNLWRERRAKADWNRGPSAYHPNALPLDCIIFQALNKWQKLNQNKLSFFSLIFQALVFFIFFVCRRVGEYVSLELFGFYILRVRVKINKRSFEPFCVCLGLTARPNRLRWLWFLSAVPSNGRTLCAGVAPFLRGSAKAAGLYSH